MWVQYARTCENCIVDMLCLFVCLLRSIGHYCLHTLSYSSWIFSCEWHLFIVFVCLFVRPFVYLFVVFLFVFFARATLSCIDFVEGIHCCETVVMGFMQI